MKTLLRRTTTISAFASIAAALVLPGCSQQTINSASNDANHDIAVANRKADQAAKAVKPAIDKISSEAKPKIASLDLGARVTTAIQANQNLPHDSIRVDASPSGVRLKGSVDTAQQKQLAGQVAQNTLGPGKTVENDLTVKGQ